MRDDRCSCSRRSVPGSTRPPRIQVQTALARLNDAARTRHIRTATGGVNALAELGEQLLSLPAARRG
jgi:hypothetical protein